VLIEYRRRGIGAALVREGIGHLRRHGMRIAKTDVRANNAGARAFLATFGFRECRAVSWMRRTLDDLPGAEEDGPAGAAAGGHEIREETANEANYAQLTRLFNETMAGHYGTKLSAVADTRHMYEVSRATGVEVYTLVARPDAGFVLALVDRTENEASGRQQGMLYSIGVRKESRRQGLGRALVLAGLRRLRATGVGEAVLFVDEAGADRAIDLYRRLGFAVTSRSLFFELDLS
jgi:mycothiol synthase